MDRHYKFQILAPKFANYDPAFSIYTVDESVYRSKLDGVQRLRGRVYYNDRAIGDDALDAEGRFRMCGDEEAWHLTLSDGDGRVVGCARYLVYPNTVHYNVLRIGQSAMGQDPEWSAQLRGAVECDLQAARQRSLLYVELGGWALSEELRKTKAALETAAGSYALGSLWGGTLGACTATVRHQSASMLRRLGGSSFMTDGQPLPAYFDPNFGCMMEVLRFDYLTPWPRLRPLIETMYRRLMTTEVLTARLDYGYLAAGSVSLYPRLREAI